MNTYEFIHPHTAEVFIIKAEAIHYEDLYWVGKIKNKTVCIFTKDYSFVKHEARGE